MSNCLKIISSGLFFTLVSCNRGISCSSSEIFSIFVGDVFTCAIHVTLGQSKVNYKDCVSGTLSASYQEIVRLDIAMYDPLFMHLLHMTH